MTEVSYHPHPSIVAEIEFLSQEELKAEAKILLGDLKQVSRGSKAITEDDLNGRDGGLAKIAWKKVLYYFDSDCTLANVI